ncbi:MAG: NAD(+)/NADH kinase [Clostridiales bacterium]|jgi:NAD+ kinase|nr:NAD(+)/NADH kinase [Clostridiales bacterium]
MIIGIYTNLSKDIGGKVTTSIFNLLSQNSSVTINLSDELRVLNLKGEYFSRNSLAQNSDLVIVLGGDGTILRIAKECALYNTMIYAINLGNRGFLTEEENFDINSQITFLLKNEYAHDRRKLIKIKTKDNNFFALNEVVLARGSRTKTMKCEVLVNGTLFDYYTSDGIIVSSPTGSTAYNISAGGPIIAPDVEAFVITPICAHSLHSRPIVVNNLCSIWISLLHAEPYAHLNIDGEDILNLADGDSIEVSTSDLVATFIRKPDYNYFSRLSNKMRKWSDIDSFNF